MKLDIIAQIVQILKDAPEVGAIEIRRGLFGAWSSVRVSKAGHGGNTVGGGGGGPAHVVVSHPAAAPGAAPTGTAPTAPPPAAPQLLEIKSPMVGTFYQSPEPAAQPYVKVGSRVTVTAQDGQEEHYTIVGSAEAHPLAGRISNESPVGKALLGKRVGEKVQVMAPAGVVSYSVTHIE